MTRSATLPFLLQGGLVMPDRDYYLNPSQKMADIRSGYQAHIAARTDTRRGAGRPGARRRASSSWSATSRRYTGAVRNPKTSARATTTGRRRISRTRRRGLTGCTYFTSAGLAHQDEFVVWQPSAVTGIAALVASEPLESWKDFLRFHLIEANSVYLPKALDEEHFKFHSQVLSGTPEQQPRWKRAVNETDDALGEAVGKLYVQRYFPPSEKARAEAMVKNLLAAFAVRIDHLEWMAPQTKARAKAKLAALKVGVGYPDHWRNYAGLKVQSGDAFGNAQRAELFELPLQPGQARQAGGSLRVGHEPAAGQCREPARDECAELPCRDPAAAVLRPQARPGYGLRRHRRHDRARDQPQLR